MRTIDKRFVIDDSVEKREGGMADVFCAVDSKRAMERVAVKIFRDGLVGPSYVLEAFYRECKSLAELNAHPNIIKLVDFGTDAESDRKYIALSWAPENLVDYVNKHKPAGWDDFYERFGRPTLNALVFAYSRNILHRDVKPQNVLLDAEQNIRVADFGISKFREYYRPGVTLAHFKSVPYAPEYESEEYADRRDVYSFAVLALECLSPKPFADYPDVYHFLEEADVPEDIYIILKKALEKNPEDRHSNVSELLLEIDDSQRARFRASVKKSRCPIFITQAALSSWMFEIGELSQQKAKDRLIAVLNETVGINRWQVGAIDTETFLLISAEYRFQAAIDRNREDRLLIVKVIRGEPSRLERLCEKAWKPPIEFYLSSHWEDLAGREVIEWLQDGLDEFLVERRRIDGEKLETQLFERWEALLRLKSEVEQLRETPINYNGLDGSGQRLTLRAAPNTTLSQDLIGQPRMIRGDDGRTVTGVVENFGNTTITLYCDLHYDLDTIPVRGKLVYDTRRANAAIRRQFASLDAVRYDRASRADLRHLLSGIQPIRIPTSISVDTYFQPDLDNDKKDAVCAALGTHDFLVIEGPPGTGKTKFITELILQFAKRNPGSRILLSSQTHNALDNALVRVRQHSKNAGLALRLARIGRRGDEKISLDVADLILEKSVEEWLKVAARNSEQFLSDWAAKSNISIDMVRTGMALASLRIANGNLRHAETELSSLKILRDRLEAAVQELRATPEKGDEYREAEEKLEVCYRDLSLVEVESQSRRAEFRKAFEHAQSFPDLKDELESLDDSDMKSLERAYLDHAPGGDKCRQLISIVEEWRDRFGRSSDFNGAYLAGCDLVAGTCIGVAGMGLQSVEFDLCIVDEASKATPTEMLVPISKSKRWVVVGDPRQLPPYVGDVMEHPRLLADFGLTRDSVKETLLDHLIRKLPDHAQKSLLTQHRMIRPIGDLVSECFYGGKLINVNSVSDRWISTLVMPRPVTWYTTARLSDRRETEKRQAGRREFRNFSEIRVIEKILKRLQYAATNRGEPYEVLLLSGYGPQVAELENLVLRLAVAASDLKIMVGTVDSFQGREADVAIYSITRSNDNGEIGFLAEQERLNVALSRAKIALAVVGDSSFCDSIKGKNPFSDVLAYIRSHQEDCALVEADA